MYQMVLPIYKVRHLGQFLGNKIRVLTARSYTLFLGSIRRFKQHSINNTKETLESLIRPPRPLRIDYTACEGYHSCIII